MQRLFVARTVPIVSKQSEHCLLGVRLSVLLRCRRPFGMKPTACKNGVVSLFRVCLADENVRLLAQSLRTRQRPRMIYC